MKGENPRVVNFYQTAVGLALTLLFFHSYISATDGATLLWSAAWGVGFAVLSLLQMYALHHVDTISLFPVTSPSSVVLSVAVALLFFGDKVSWLQGLGILLTVVTVYMFLYKGKTL